jgi:hypothetical protein
VLEDRLVPSSVTHFQLSAPGSAVAGSTLAFSVTAEDAQNHPVTDYTGTVQFTSSDRMAGLPGNYTFTLADGGTHAFPGTFYIAGNQSLTVTDTSDGSITGSTTIAVSPGAAAHLYVDGPWWTTAGTVNSLTITAYDSFGNVVTGYTGTVHFTSSDAQAGLPADYTYTAADAGQHTFNATMKTAGHQTVTVSDAVNGIAGSIGIIVAPGPLAGLTFSNQPAGTIAGAGFNFTLSATDAYGNVITGYTDTVHFTSSDALAGLPGDYTFTAGDSGTHTFSATLYKAGGQSLTATDTTSSSITGSATLAVSADAAASLYVTDFPPSATAGSANNFTVTAYDRFGNVATGYRGTVHFTSSDARAVLPVDYNFTATDAGRHTFNVTMETAGAQTVTVADSGDGLSKSAGITVTPGSAVALSFSNLPASTIAGASFNFTLTASDAYGNVATGYTGTVHFACSDLMAGLPGNYTFGAAEGGVHTFTATLYTAGNQSLSATDTANSSVTGSSNIAVSAAGVASLSVTNSPPAMTAGTTNSLTITAHDRFGNIVTGYTGSIHFTSSDGQAGLPADYAFTAADGGKHTFNFTLKTAGAGTVTSNDATDGLSTTISVTVSPATASALDFSSFPASASAGTVLSLTITAVDAYGNVATGYRGSLHFTSRDGKAVLPPDYTFAAADAGKHTFSTTFKTAGAQTISGTDSANSAFTGTAGTSVLPGAASVLTVAGFSTPTVSGVAHSFTVTLYDPYGNVATGYTGTVHFTSSDASAQLPGDYKFVAADAGSHSFSANLMAAGTQSITATDTASSSITGVQSNILVQPDPPAAGGLVIAGFPSPTEAGDEHSFTVTVEDSQGHVITNYQGTVHFTSSDGRATFSAWTYTFSAADKGVHTFRATLKTAGQQSITATDTSNSGLTGSEGKILVEPGEATHLVVAGFPSQIAAGTSHTITVTAEDAYGNVATGYTGTIYLGSSDQRATFSNSSYKFTTADHGAHVFSGTFYSAGYQKIEAHDVHHRRIRGEERHIKVEAAAANRLLVLTPRHVQTGRTFCFAVVAVDAYGNLANFTGSIDFSSDGPGKLPGEFTFDGDDHGFRWFRGNFSQQGKYHITVSATGNPDLKGTSASIEVRGKPSHCPEDRSGRVSQGLLLGFLLAGKRDHA